jgi:NTP pyrophosphatase (non-canonical NTP hydrolase)
MKFNEYQIKATVFGNYPVLGARIVYPALGLAGEAGEVAEKVKKLMRDQGGFITEAFRENLKKELGDVLWYVSEVADAAGLTLDEVAVANIEKLTSRHKRGVIHGEGDNR